MVDGRRRSASRSIFLLQRGSAFVVDMSKEFTAIMSDGTERFAASLANDRARLFFEIAKLLEHFVGMPSGIAADIGEDEHRIHPARFIPFFGAVHAAGWITEPKGLVRGWASYAAGMIENITLTPKQWHCRDGSGLPVSRYLRNEEIPTERKP